MKKKILIIIVKILDLLFSPLTILSILWFKIIRKINIGRMNISRNLFNYFGLLPIHDHYYEPLINPKKHLLSTLKNDRKLLGIDFNVDKQKELIDSFNYNDELLEFPVNNINNNKYFYNNGFFKSGDSEYLYNLIRKFKPKKIIEIGSGFSTRMIINSINKNKEEDINYTCDVKCIEPYRFFSLEKLPVQIIKEKVEMVDMKLFKILDEDDFVFIDSTHIIRPQGDVLYEIQNILPYLNKGVLIHFHDIFTPKDYPEKWIINHRLWNEQYLLESFLTFNNNFEIIGSLNYLKHHHWDLLSSKCPILSRDIQREPSSFWIRKIK